MSPRFVVKVRGQLNRLPLRRARLEANEGAENARAWRAMIANVAAKDSARKTRIALMQARLRSEQDTGDE